MDMTSNCDVTNSAHQIQMTTIWPWTTTPQWKFSAYATAGKGEVRRRLHFSQGIT